MYSARVTHSNRTAFIILCDHSGSMAEQATLNRERIKKSEAVAIIINMLIEELVNRSRRDTGIMDYFDIAVLGYSGKGVTSLLSDKGGFTSIAEIVRRPISVRKHHILRNLPSGNQIAATVDRKYWIEAHSSGDTPMCAALIEAEKLLNTWCRSTRNADSFPPIIINITDGEASDGDCADLTEIAARIKNISTRDGCVLLFNIHLASSGDSHHSLSFPCDDDPLPANKYAEMLYTMSSEIPECYNELISASSHKRVRAVSYNCQIDELFSLLAIGTASSSFTI